MDCRQIKNGAAGVCKCVNAWHRPLLNMKYHWTPRLICLGFLIIVLQHVQPTPAFSQGFQERLSGVQGTACMVFSCFGNQGAFGTGAIEYINVDSNAVKRAFPETPDTIVTNMHIGVLITAKHMLFSDPDRMQGLATDLYVKFNRDSSSKTASWVHIPVAKSEPRNFWLSERGFDLAVVPIPGPLVNDGKFTFIVNYLTAKNSKDLDISAGTLAIASVIQFEFLDERDFDSPEVIPLLRCGHIARLGLISTTDTNEFTREHVVDIHASHGNSGSPVLTALAPIWWTAKWVHES